MMKMPRPVMLVIMDGWGYREEADNNAVYHANTPVWDDLWAHYPHSLVDASEGEVGLPAGQMGNSEVGHMNIGAGRVMMQDLPRIDTALADGSLANNPRVIDMIAQLKTSGGTAHLMGLLSDGGVHAHQSHIIGMAKIFATAGIPVALHAFLDGRDTPPKSAESFINAWLDATQSLSNVYMASICGRYFAMDRDKRWDRVERAYNAIALGKAAQGASPLETLTSQYAVGKTDEFIEPTIFNGYNGLKDQDALIMCNFRADRAREILHCFVDDTFTNFDRPSKPVLAGGIIGMTEYSSALKPYVPALFPQENTINTLGEVLAKRRMRQLRIAETEKYAHVTFFFNGGVETPYAGEDRILVPSPNVATYDLQPEMSAPEVTDKLVEAIEAATYDLIVVNYANTDMVGHTGDMAAAIKAVEAVDTALGRLKTALDKAGGVMLITADHGNAEMMHDVDTGQAHTAHTLEKVPAVLYGKDYRDSATTLRNGRLADLAPTLLHLMFVPQPAEMTGKSLIIS
jgi:2,3-bisphosphoglycerate-independent phosphoglycerate mutase